MEDFTHYMANSIFNDVFLELTLPYYDDFPSHRLKTAPNFLISFLVSFYFCSPKIRISLWNSIVFTTIVTMPETAVDEDDSSVFGKDNIWGTR